MKIYAQLVLAILLLAPGSETERLTDSMKFAIDFYRAVKEESPTKNVIISPLSVETSLGFLLMGAGGTVADQLTRGLYLNTTDRNAIASHFRGVLDFTSRVMKVANKLYTQIGYEVQPDFSSIVGRDFLFKTESIQFWDKIGAVKTINSWVENFTEGKIKNMFSPDMLTHDTRMALVNSVYFKDSWKYPFIKEATQKRPFWISENQTVEVDMMYSVMRIERAEIKELNAQIAMLPYKNSELSMMVIVPNEKEGLAKLESKLDSFDFYSIRRSFRTSLTDVVLPKLTIESTVDLKTVLTKMGMGEIFSDNPNYLDILASNQPLKIDSAVHKTFIELDEEGTVAAGATEGPAALDQSKSNTGHKLIAANNNNSNHGWRQQQLPVTCRGITSSIPRVLGIFANSHSQGNSTMQENIGGTGLVFRLAHAEDLSTKHGNGMRHIKIRR